MEMIKGEKVRLDRRATHELSSLVIEARHCEEVSAKQWTRVSHSIIVKVPPSILHVEVGMVYIRCERLGHQFLQS